MSADAERKVFLTFGGGGTWPSAARRLKKQAEESGMFDDVFFETSENFFTENPEFLMHKPFIERNPRGWGYWIWKPFLVLKYLSRLEEGDSLFYLDAGCEILPENGVEFKSIFDHLSANGSAFFDYSQFPIFNLTFWTKQSLLDELQNEFSLSTDDCLTIPKITAASFGLVRSARNIAFLKDWNRLAIKDNYHLVDDTPSPAPRIHPIFEHRHDQSIMSALKFIYGFPNYRSAGFFDYIDLGVDCFPLTQPFLICRNPMATSKVERFRSTPAEKTFSTAIAASELSNQYIPLLASVGLINDWKQSRNSACYCRSGKRFKHCHGVFF